MSDPIKCPNCGTEFEATVTLSPESRMWFEIKPHPGQYLTAETVGESISQFEKLFLSLAAHDGLQAKMLVTGLEYTDGAVKIGVNLLRFRPPSELPTNPTER